MPPRTVGTKAGAWTELTSSTVESITFQNIGSAHVLLQGTSGAAAPGSVAGAWRYNPGQGERAVPLAELFPAVVGANRVWAWCEAPGKVSVQHA